MRKNVEINDSFFQIKNINLLRDNPVVFAVLAKNSKDIVKRLEEIEKGSFIDPFFDVELMKLVLPNDVQIPQQFRKKWLTVVCVLASIKHDFSYGNLFVPSEDLK